MIATVDTTKIAYKIAMALLIKYAEEELGIQEPKDLFRDYETQDLTPEAFEIFKTIYDEVFDIVIQATIEEEVGDFKPFNIAPIQLFNWNVRFKGGQPVHITIIDSKIISVNNTPFTLEEAFNVLERFDAENNEYIPFGQR